MESYFTPSPKIKARLLENTKLGKEKVNEFIGLIKDIDDEERVFELFTGWSTPYEKFMMYKTIEKYVDYFLNAGEIDDSFLG